MLRSCLMSISVELKTLATEWSCLYICSACKRLFVYVCVGCESIRQDGLTGSAWGDWANYTASPLRAFENELGVQEPVGFWDPAGFTADGDVSAFKRRRSVELKHGRISMMATMGFLTARENMASLADHRQHGTTATELGRSSLLKCFSCLG